MKAEHPKKYLVGYRFPFEIFTSAFNYGSDIVEAKHTQVLRVIAYYEQKLAIRKHEKENLKKWKHLLKKAKQRLKDLIREYPEEFL